MKRGTVIVAAIGLFLALGAAGCGGGSSSSESTSGAAKGGKAKIAGQTVNDHGTKTVSGDETEMELDDYYFEPTLLRGKPGANVKLELKNEGSAEHNLTIASQGIDKDVEAGEDANRHRHDPEVGRSSPSTASTTGAWAWPARSRRTTPPACARSLRAAARRRTTRRRSPTGTSA